MNGVRKSRTMLAAAGLVAAFAGTARAADFCLDWMFYGFIPQHAVGRGFRVPPPGRCRPFMGVIPENGSDVTGSACTASDGSKVRFVLTETAPATDPQSSSVFFYNVRLPLPLGGPGVINIHRDPLSAAQLVFGYEDSVSGGPCSSPTPID